MEKKNLAVSIFVFVAILLSAYVVQIECSAIKKQERFRREENGKNWCVYICLCFSRFK